MERRGFLKLAAAAAVGSGLGFYAGRIEPNRRYVQLGTSLTAGSGTKLNGLIPFMVGHKLGMEGINGGCPGSCAGDHKFPLLNPVSLFALANAIVSGDWSAQAQSPQAGVSQLMLAGFNSSVTHIGLEYGTNDFRYDRPVGTDDDFSSETFKGALNHSIQALIRRYPNVRVFVMTPWWMPTLDGRDSDANPNEAGFFLRDYVAAIQRVAELNRIPCLDLWNGSGVSKFNHRDFTVEDGTHLNDAGALRRADLIAGFMRSL